MNNSHSEESAPQYSAISIVYKFQLWEQSLCCGHCSRGC